MSRISTNKIVFPVFFIFALVLSALFPAGFTQPEQPTVAHAVTCDAYTTTVACVDDTSLSGYYLIANGSVMFSVNSTTGYLAGIYHKTGTDHTKWLNNLSSTTGTWPLGLRVGTSMKAADITSSSTSQSISSHTITNGTGTADLELVYNNFKFDDGTSTGIKVTIWFDINDDSASSSYNNQNSNQYVKIHATIDNTSGTDKITQLFFGSGGALIANDAPNISNEARKGETLAVPKFEGGFLYNDPYDTAGFATQNILGYPGPLNNSLQMGWLDLDSPTGGGIGIAYIDKQQLAMDFRFQQDTSGGGGMSMMPVLFDPETIYQGQQTEETGTLGTGGTVATAVYMPVGQTFTTDTYIIAPHTGDWHTMADIYRTEYDNSFQVSGTPDYLTWNTTGTSKISSEVKATDFQDNYWISQQADPNGSILYYLNFEDASPTAIWSPDSTGTWSIGSESVGGVTNHFYQQTNASAGFNVNTLQSAGTITASSMQDTLLTARIRLDSAPDYVGGVSQSSSASFLFRYSGYSDFVRLLTIDDGLNDGKFYWGIQTNIGGTWSTPTLYSGTSPKLSQSTWYRVKFEVQGNSMWGKVWTDGTAEPAAWMLGPITFSNTAPMNKGTLALSTALEKASFDDVVISAAPLYSVNSYYEDIPGAFQNDINYYYNQTSGNHSASNAMAWIVGENQHEGYANDDPLQLPANNDAVAPEDRGTETGTQALTAMDQSIHTMGGTVYDYNHPFVFDPGGSAYNTIAVTDSDPGFDPNQYIAQWNNSNHHAICVNDTNVESFWATSGTNSIFPAWESAYIDGMQFDQGSVQQTLCNLPGQDWLSRQTAHITTVNQMAKNVRSSLASGNGYVVSEGGNDLLTRYIDVWQLHMDMTNSDGVTYPNNGIGTPEVSIYTEPQFIRSFNCNNSDELLQAVADGGINTLNCGTTVQTDNFGSDTVGNNATGWSTTGGTWHVVGSQVQFNGNTSNAYQQTATVSTPVLAYTGSNSLTDYNVVANIFTGSSTVSDEGIIARYNSATNSYVRLVLAGTFWELQTVNGGSYGSSPAGAIVTTTISPNTWYKVAMSIQGNKVTGSVWPEGTSAPTRSQATLTLLSTDSQAGQAGLETAQNPVYANFSVTESHYPVQQMYTSMKTALRNASAPGYPYGFKDTQGLTVGDPNLVARAFTDGTKVTLVYYDQSASASVNTYIDVNLNQLGLTGGVSRIYVRENPLSGWYSIIDPSVPPAGPRLILNEPFDEDAVNQSPANGWGNTSGSTWTVLGSGINGTSDHYYQQNDRTKVFVTSNTGLGTTTDSVVSALVDFNQGSDGTHEASISVLARYTSDSNLVRWIATQETNGSGSWGLQTEVGGTWYTAANWPQVQLKVGTWYNVKLQVVGSTVSAKVWEYGQPEPSAWQYSYTFATIPAAGSAGVATGYASANFDNVVVSDLPALNESFNEDAVGQSPATGWGNTSLSTWTVEGSGLTGSLDNFYQQSNTSKSYVNAYSGVSTWTDTLTTALVEYNAGDGVHQGSLGILARYNDDADLIRWVALEDTNGTTGSWGLQTEVGGTWYTSASWPATKLTAGTWYNVKLQVVGSTVSAKVWANGTTEPSSWYSYTFTTLPSSGKSGLNTGYTNTSFDNVVVYDLTN